MAPSRTPSTLFGLPTFGAASLHDAHSSRQSFTTNGISDLEKADTVDESSSGTASGAVRTYTSGRVSRIQSLGRKRAVFDHPLSHVKTSTDVLVDFDGPDDPYRPINWPFRKKVITTALYGFTTMGSTWASSV